MSAFVFRNKGTLASGTIALTPGAPAGKTVGDLLLMPACTRDNGQTLDPVANAWLASWTDVSAQVHGVWNHLYARYADGTALDTPTVDFTNTPHGIAQIAAFSGGGAVALASLVSASIDKSATNLNVPYDALTITEDNTLCVAVSTHNKTTASDAATFAALSPFTKIDENYGAGTDLAFWWGYNIQTSKTNFASGTHTYTGSADTLQYTSLIVALKSGAAGAAARRRLGSAPVGLKFVRTY